jgi:hypothetical protein
MFMKTNRSSTLRRWRVVERPRRRDARRRRRRLEVGGLLPDSRRIAHFLLPAVVSRGISELVLSWPDLRNGSLDDLDVVSTPREYFGNEGISEISPCLKLMQTAVVRRPFKVRALAC